MIPADFETDGPHRLVLQARVRTVGLTDSWELELPHIPFSFEFDPRLAVDALFALPDDARGLGVLAGPSGSSAGRPAAERARRLPRR